jgi:hypothetical protein
MSWGRISHRPHALLLRFARAGVADPPLYVRHPAHPDKFARESVMGRCYLDMSPR